MKIFKMVKKGIELKIWSKVKDYRLAQANLRIFDEDDTEFKYWATKYREAIDKYWEIANR